MDKAVLALKKTLEWHVHLLLFQSELQNGIQRSDAYLLYKWWTDKSKYGCSTNRKKSVTKVAKSDLPQLGNVTVKLVTSTQPSALW